MHKTGNVIVRDNSYIIDEKVFDPGIIIMWFFFSFLFIFILLYICIYICICNKIHENS
jgi:magnesium-transporting ATPase (P-type)